MPTTLSAPRSPPASRSSWLDAHPIEVLDEIDAKCGYENQRTDITGHRARLMALARQGVEYRAALVDACRKSMDFWVDGFVTTYKQAQFDENGRQTALVGENVIAPYVTWPIQSALRREIDAAVRDGRDVIIPKSREMRATWDVLLWLVHRFLFQPGFTAILVSEIEDKVDKKGNPDALFHRIDFVLRHLPPWMWPGELHRTDKHVGWNIPGDVRSLDGTSTTENVAVGGRRTAILLDEAARNPYLREIWDATRDTRAARIVVSTPLGPGFFRELCFSSNKRIFPMGYWDHPDKGKGRELREDDGQGSVTGKPGRKFWWSPWFEIERHERTRIDVGQNLLLDFDIGGNAVFDSAVVMQTIEEGQRFPPRVGRLVHDLEGAERDLSIRRRERDAIKFVDDPRGNLCVWCELDRNGNPIVGPCCFGADVSNGLGQSNSTLAGIEIDTGVEIAKLADANLTVHEFARVYAMLGIWLGHHSERRDKWQCAAGNFEANGSGQNLEKYLRELGYSPLHHDGDKSGWHSNLKSKRAEMEEVSRALSLGTLIVRDVPTLQEASTYVYTVSGGVEPEVLGQEPGARATHGDRCIATLTAWIIARRGRTVPKKDLVPPDTIAGIEREYLRKIKEKRRLEG